MTTTPAASEWAQQNFAETDLGDKRRTARLTRIASRFAADPEASLPQGVDGTAELMGAYRFLNNPNVNPQDIFGHHRQLVAEAMAERDDDVVLCVQDTTTLDFSGRVCEDLGSIGNGQGNARGLLQHSALAVTEDGQVLGLLHSIWHKRVEAPENEKRSQRHKRHGEGDLWQDTVAAVGEVPGMRLLHVGDRGADIFGLMQDCDRAGHGFLLRAKHDRKLDEKPLHLQEKIELSPASATQPLWIPGKGSRKGREAQIAVRWCSVNLPCPPYASEDPAPVRGVQAVEVFEPDPPEGEDPVRWILLTSEPVEGEADAWLTVERYRKRWVIEEWHKVMKSGCRLEWTQLKTADAVRRLAAVISVVAVRMMQLRDAATAVERGEAPAAGNVFASPLSDPAWLTVIAEREGVAEDEVDAAVLFRSLARRGGHLGRKHDPRPGWACLWRGYQKLSLMVEGVRCVKG